MRNTRVVSNGDEGYARALRPEWFAPIATAGTALAYLTGYLQLAFFASALGLTVGDLALDFRDYVVLAVVNAAVFAVVMGMFAFAAHLEPGIPSPLRKRLIGSSPRRWVRATRTTVVEALRSGALGGALLVGGLLGLNASGALVVLAGVACLVVIHYTTAGSGFGAIGGYVATACVVVGFIGLTCLSAHLYAERLQDAAASTSGDVTPLPPVTLRTVLQPEVGLASSAGTTNSATCAIRVSSHVLLGRDAVVIGPVDRFTRRSCSVVAVPFE